MNRDSKIFINIFLTICLLCLNQQAAHSEDYIKFVNPFIGTAFRGNTYPGATVPFGMLQLSPDTYVTGETSHANYWAASDHAMNVIFAGHYATETVGVKALGRRLEQKFGLETRLLDFPTEM